MSLSTLVRRSALLGLLLGIVPGAGAQQRQAAPVDSPFLTAPPVESAVDKLLAPEPSFGTAPATSFLRTGGPDAFGYTYKDSAEPDGPTFSWIDISSTSSTPGVSVAAALADDGSGSVPIGFSFSFYGASYTSINVGSNGMASFTAAATAFSNTGIPSTSAPNQMVAPMWDDFDFRSAASPTGEVRYLTTGTAPNRQLVISWINGRARCGTTPPAGGCTTPAQTFQAILFEGTNNIRFQYLAASGVSATGSTVGIEGTGATTPAPGQGLQILRDNSPVTGYLQNNLAIEITAPPPPPPDVAFGSAAMASQNVGTVYANNSSFWFGSRSTVVISGTFGTLPMTSATFDLSGSTDPSDIVEARLYYTGASVTAPNLASPQFGSSVLNPGSSVTFTGTLDLGAGNHNFWIVLRLANGTQGDVISNAFTSVTINGTARTPSPTTLGNVLTLGDAASNDNLVNARRVHTSSYSNSQQTGGATREVGEAFTTCGGGNDGLSIWYRYTPSVDGTVTATAGGFDTTLGLYTGSAFPLTELDCSDGPNGTEVEEVSAAVTAGTTYYIRVAGWNGNFGVAAVTVTGPEPVADDEFVFSRPTAGQIFRIGKPLKPIWTSAPIIAASTVTVSLCAVEGSCDAPHYTGPNLVQPDFLDARLIIPPSTAPGSYTLRACVAGDPNNCVDSPVFSIIDPTNVFVITSPAQAASGTDATIEWTSPPTDPPTDVTLTVSSRGGETTYATLTTANDGSETVTIPPVPNGSYLLTVCPSSGPDPTCGKSVVVVRPLVVTEPDGSLVWTPGSTQTVSWSTAACGSGTATADIYLRRSSGGKTLLADDTDCDDTEDITVPAGAADASDYFVQVQVFDGGSRVATGNSATFSVGTPIRVAGTSRVDAPLVSGTADAIVRVATPGLADGSEVSVSAGRLVLGTGIVRAGEAEVALFGMVADPMLMASGLTAEEAMEIVEAGTELRVTTWSAAGEAPLELGRITDADGREVAALTFEIGSEYVVAAKGATTTTADVFTLDRVSPNPTSGPASVRFTLAESQAVRVTVYDLLGREVATLFDGTATAGANEVGVPALTAGVYVVRVATPSTSATTRFTVVR